MEQEAKATVFSATDSLEKALADGAALAGSPSPAIPQPNLETVLENRLNTYYDRLPAPGFVKPNPSTLQNLQLQTAKEALSVLHRVQNIIDSEPAGNSTSAAVGSNPSNAPSIGARDLALLRTLLSISFKWGLEPLFLRVSQEWPSELFDKVHGPQIVDLTTDKDMCSMLSDMLSSMFSLVFPEGPDGRISQTLITTTILTRHVADLLPPAIALGWVPAGVLPDSLLRYREAKPLVMRILRLLHPAQAIVALGSILSSTSIPKLSHVQKACASLLSGQLLRSDGIQGLFEAVLSADEAAGDEVKVEKLEHIARTVISAPSSKVPKEYYQFILPKVLKFLTSDSHPSHRRAAAFVIFRAIDPPKRLIRQSSASTVLLDILHQPFLEPVDLPDEQMSNDTKQDPRDTLSALVVLLSNTEPSPTFVSKLLSPIIPALYLLSYDLNQIKTADPLLKETVNGLLVSWGKIIDQEEGCNTAWAIIEGGKEGSWSLDPEGRLRRLQSEDREQSLLLPRDIQNSHDDVHEDDAFRVDLNLFNLYPDPVHFVETLKFFDRSDISSALFLRLLENYRDMKSSGGRDSMRLLHKLQIIVQMQNRLSERTTSSILRKSDRLLSFIYNVLASVNGRVSGNGSSIPSEILTTDEDEYTDSDDEAADSEAIGPNDELIETTITLLLSILEADETLSSRTQPILNDIFATLEPLALKGSSVLAPLAREARLVITARLAEIPANGQKQTAEEDPQEIYQKALKLLQDPILPVRAHGLLLLRQLASSPSAEHRQAEKALVPSILSIFLQCVQDDDSYMFLNAVQGLTALVRRYGKEILGGLVNNYAGGLDGLGAGNLTQKDIDVRTRIGEALSSVIKQCGNTLGLYIDILVPRLFAVVRGSNIATALRTSALSLLADCVDTYPWAVLPYLEDLVQATVDLLQTESITMREKYPEKKTFASEKQKVEDQDIASSSTSSPEIVTMDSAPTSTDSKFPPLRRAALHFLSLLIRSATQIIYDEHPSLHLVSEDVYRRVHLTLGYVASTDEDDVVRVMAREAKESLEQLKKATVGL